MTNCFCVPHKEYEERVEADLKFAEDMFDLNKKVEEKKELPKEEPKKVEEKTPPFDGMRDHFHLNEGKTAARVLAHTRI